MTDGEPMTHEGEALVTKDAEATIRASIMMLLDRRGAAPSNLHGDSRLTDDLGLDSLELAELSAILEDELGRDPYSEGVVPQTLTELVAFYRS